MHVGKENMIGSVYLILPFKGEARQTSNTDSNGDKGIRYL